MRYLTSPSLVIRRRCLLILLDVSGMSLKNSKGTHIVFCSSIRDAFGGGLYPLANISSSGFSVANTSTSHFLLGRCLASTPWDLISRLFMRSKNFLTSTSIEGGFGHAFNLMSQIRGQKVLPSITLIRYASLIMLDL